MGTHRLHAKHGSSQIHIDDSIPLRFRYIEERLALYNSRRVHQVVYLSELLNRRVHQSLYLAHIRNVYRVRDRASLFCDNLSCGDAGLITVDISNDNTGAFMCEAYGDPFPDALCRASHYRGLVCKA